MLGVDVVNAAVLGCVELLDERRFAHTARAQQMNHERLNVLVAHGRLRKDRYDDVLANVFVRVTVFQLDTDVARFIVHIVSASLHRIVAGQRKRVRVMVTMWWSGLLVRRDRLGALFERAFERVATVDHRALVCRVELSYAVDFRVALMRVLVEILEWQTLRSTLTVHIGVHERNGALGATSALNVRRSGPNTMSRLHRLTRRLFQLAIGRRGL